MSVAQEVPAAAVGTKRRAVLGRLVAAVASPKDHAGAQGSPRPRIRPAVHRLTYLEDARLQRELSKD